MYAIEKNKHMIYEWIVQVKISIVTLTIDGASNEC